MLCISTLLNQNKYLSFSCSAAWIKCTHTAEGRLSWWSNRKITVENRQLSQCIGNQSLISFQKKGTYMYISIEHRAIPFFRNLLLYKSPE